MDRQAPQTHRSTTAQDTRQDARPAQLPEQPRTAPSESGVQRHKLRDPSGDPLTVHTYADGDVRLNTPRAPVVLDRDGARQLRDLLDAHLGDREGDAGLDVEPRTILQEAQDAVYGDRQQDYGHPREDFTRTAILWTGLLHHKLADGAHLEPEDIARCQIGVKLARDVHAPKRDNRVDMAGYALTLDRLETGR